MEEQGKKLVVIAGANGTGKTTFFYQNKLADDYIFVNADEIAKEILLAHSDNNSDVRIIAGKEAVNTVYGYLANNINFAIETTLSGNFPIKVIKKALNHNYEIVLSYIGVDSPEDSVKRIEHRVREGGHNVPTTDVMRRYHRSLENLPKVIELVHVAQIIDNSKQQYERLLRFEKGVLVSVYVKKFPDWLKETISIDALKIGHKVYGIENDIMLNEKVKSALLDYVQALQTFENSVGCRNVEAEKQAMQDFQQKALNIYNNKDIWENLAEVADDRSISFAKVGGLQSIADKLQANQITEEELGMVKSHIHKSARNALYREQTRGRSRSR